MKNIFALDIGNKQVKLMSEKSTRIMPSVFLNKYDTQGIFNISKPDGVDTYNIPSQSEEYYWGNGVSAFPDSKLIDTISFDNRYNQEPYRLLMEFALANLASDYENDGKTALDVNVIVGLPTSDYSVENIKTVIRDLKRTRIVNMNDKNYIINVEHVVTLPQPVGSLYNEMLSDDGYIRDADLQDETVGIVDIGGGTLLLDEFNGFALDSYNRIQLEKGATYLYDRISSSLVSVNGFNPDSHMIEQMVKNGLNKKGNKFVYQQSKNNVFDLTEMVNEQIKRYTKEICYQIPSIFKNLKTMDVLMFTGGTANIIDRDFVMDYFGKLSPSLEIRWCDTPELSNVRGFYKYGLSQELIKKATTI